jgi:hypothetical protein
MTQTLNVHVVSIFVNQMQMASSKSSNTDKPMRIHIHPQCGACNALFLPDDHVVARMIFGLSSPSTCSNTNINTKCFALKTPFERIIRLLLVGFAIAIRDSHSLRGSLFAMSLQAKVATLPMKA